MSAKKSIHLQHPMLWTFAEVVEIVPWSGLILTPKTTSSLTSTRKPGHLNASVDAHVLTIVLAAIMALMHFGHAVRFVICLTRE